MQFMPDTWSEWGKGAPVDPEASLDAGVRYMQWLLGQFKGAADPPALAFAAYNWGIGHVKKAITKSGRTDWDGIKSFMHSETRAYVERILARASKYRTIFQGPVAGPSVTPGGSPLRFDEGGFINLRTLGLMALAGLLGLVLLRKILG